MTAVTRMGIAALALIGAFIATYMLLYKLGVLGVVVCGVSGGCEIVQASHYAYFIGVPVAAWGLLGYLAILGVALLGIQPAFIESRRVSLLLLVLTGTAFAFSVYLSILEEFVIGAWCRWCIASAIISTLLLGLALPELRRVRVR